MCDSISLTSYAGCLSLSQVISNTVLANKRCTHAQSNYTNAELKPGLGRLLHHLARKRSGPILQPRPHGGSAEIANTGKWVHKHKRTI